MKNCILLLILIFLTTSFVTAQPYATDWNLIVDELDNKKLTTADIVGWSFVSADTTNVITQCGIHSVLGGYGVTGPAATLNKKFLNMPAHWRLKIEVDVLFIESWDNEWFRIHVDNIPYVEVQSYVPNHNKQMCGNAGWNEQLRTFVFELNHSSPFLNIKFSSTLDEGSTNEAWGIRNFKIYGAVGQWTLSVNNFFNQYLTTSDLSGWNVASPESTNYITRCTDGDIFGGYGVFNGSSTLSRTISNLPSHFKIKIVFDFYYVDSWDNETLNVKIDGANVLSSTQQWQTANWFHLCGNGAYQDKIVTHVIEFDHLNSFFDIHFSTTINEGATNESWGIRNFQVWTTASRDLISDPMELWDDPFSATSIPTANLSGWSFTTPETTTKISTCGPYSMVGGFGIGGYGAVLLKAYNNLPPHLRLLIAVDVWILDTWDNETIYMTIDDVQVKSQMKLHSSFPINYCGTQYTDGYHTWIYDINHINKNLKVQFHSNLNEVAANESWGIRNFQIWLLRNPYTLVYNPFYQDTITSSDLSGWTFSSAESASTITQCGSYSLVGGYGVCGQNTQLTTTVSNLPPHWQVRINVSVMIIDSWDYEMFYMYVDNVLVAEFRGYLFDNPTQLCGVQSAGWNEQLVTLNHTFSHSASSFVVRFASTLNEPSTNESWGIRNFQVWVVSGNWSLQDNPWSTTTIPSTALSGWTFEQPNNAALITSCGGKDIVGGFETTVGGSALVKTYTNMPGHYKVKIKVDVYLLDTWDSEYFRIFVDGVIVQNYQHNFGSSPSNICGGTWNDRIVTLEAELYHNSSSIEVRFDSTLDDQPAEGWGVRNYELWTMNCDYPCGTCSGNSTNCKTCATTPSRISNTSPINCTCNSTSIETGSVAAGGCQSCAYPCLTCGANINICNSCVTTQFRTSTTNCTCIAGYYETGSACAACTYPCATCLGSASSCQSCSTTANRVSTTNCACNNHYYETNSSTTGCQICDYKCGNCSGTSTACSTCADATREGATCLCKATYYNSGTNPVCLACVYPCLNCTSATTCTSCNNATQRASTTTCACNDHYYETNSSTTGCQICDYKCGNCSGNSTACSTCADATREGATCLCKATYYNSGTNPVCLACVYPCLNCTSATSCLTCQTPADRVAIDDCTCGDGFYETGTQCSQCDDTKCAKCVNSNDNCTLPCNSDCSTCDATGLCTSCPLGQFTHADGSCDPCDNTLCATCSGNPTSCIIDCNSDCATCDKTGLCTSCPSGTYLTSTGYCLPCDYPCATCVTTASNCLSCETTEHRISNTNCGCVDGYYDTDSQCEICIYPCQTCNTTNDTCDTCVTTAFRTSVNDCTCIDGYYETGSECAVCVYPCLTCVNTASNCLSCKTSANRISNTDCRCQDGYYETGSECQACQYPCSKCTSTVDCLTCETTANRVSISNCTCSDGYWETGSQCEVCDNRCSTCSKSASVCDSCKGTALLSNNCICLDGQYDDGNYGCSQCVFPCVNCTSDTNCLSCDGDHRILPTCNCIRQYFQNTSRVCQQCELQCATCVQSQSNCLECARGLKRSLIAPKCGCLDGYYSDTTSLDCKQCGSQCKTCSNASSCDTCLISTLRPPLCKKQSQGFFAVDSDSSNLEFSKCDVKCDVCETSPDNCLTCKVGANRENIIPECKCNKGYYSLGGSIDCSPCAPECEECVDFNGESCQVCKTGLNRILNSFTGVCDCQRGFREKLNNFDANGTKDLTCHRCYQYESACLFECPKNTVADDDNFVCNDIRYEFTDSGSIIMTVGLLICAMLAVITGLFICLAKKKLIKYTKVQITTELPPSLDKQNKEDAVLEVKSVKNYELPEIESERNEDQFMVSNSNLKSGTQNNEVTEAPIDQIIEV